MGRRPAAAAHGGRAVLRLELPGPPTPLYVLLAFLLVPIITPVLYLVLSFVLFLVLRREWLAWGAVWLLAVVLFTAPLLGPSPTGNALTVFWSGLRVRPASLRPGPLRADRFRGPGDLYRAAVAGATDHQPVGLVRRPRAYHGADIAGLAV